MSTLCTISWLDKLLLARDQLSANSFKESSKKLSTKACKVSAMSIGLPAECSLGNVKIFDHLTPQTQKLFAKAKKFQVRNGFRFCWSKNFIVYLQKSEESHPAQKPGRP